ncbi:MAG: succinate dehydrogenase, cytochrome b556 subunit [Candidatus Pelagibacter sp.]|jgi:succinate dehydrogenase / fumarate reductase cytochrome b subunit|nr:succinate dehydrogenase, cytochrome b556 subunit [Candidatus Pelagibacter sp.]RZO51474.1 MAG: succinate dehydrogenase, cytochrome b556 subunit [Pelagibacterales bacterium]|tara:strand:- start:1051 stop:1434 length:384 start_codon:yes stop_codon:yes gene_type:complete
MKNNNPISPHIQIYNWHISSLVSISHRISGVINFLFFIFLSGWILLSILLGQSYEIFYTFYNTIFGKFFLISIIWSFSFQILSEIRHLFWDFGYGFDLKISNISGLVVIFGSFILTIFIFLVGRQII